MVNPYNHVYVDCQVAPDQVPRTFIALKSEVEPVTVTGITRKRKYHISPETLQSVQKNMKSDLCSTQKEHIIPTPKKRKSLVSLETDEDDDDTDLDSLRKRLLKDQKHESIAHFKV